MLPAKLRVISYSKPCAKSSSSIGAICVLLAAAFLGGVAVFILKARKATATQVQSEVQSVSAPAATPAPATLSFANLSRATFRDATKSLQRGIFYHPLTQTTPSWTRVEGFTPKHGWYLTPEALVLKWISNETRFDRIEGSGVYSGPKSIGGRRLMEKQPADPSDLLKPAAVPVAGRGACSSGSNSLRIRDQQTTRAARQHSIPPHGHCVGWGAT